MPIEVAPVFAMARSKYPLVDDETGASTILTLSDQEAAQLEVLRANYDGIFGPLSGLGVPRERVLMFWTFKTQSIGSWLLDIKEDVLTWTITHAEGSGKLKAPDADLATALPHADRVLMDGLFRGYTALQTVDLEADPPLYGSMKLDDDGQPDFKDIELSYLFLLPKETGQLKKPFPLVILQHGLYGDSQQVLSQADRFLEAGYAVLAMDLVLHGSRKAPNQENGAGFFSADVVATRDHLVQSALDLVQLTAFATGSNGGLEDWLGEDLLDTDAVFFVGNSLGAMAGTLALAVTDQIKVAALVVPGGHLTRILEETPEESFREDIVGALAAMGLQPDTPEYQEFMDTAQALLDRADPVNYAGHLARAPLADYMDKKKVLILRAQEDDFMPLGASMELACAARDGQQPYVKAYAQMCHAFFFAGCDGSQLDAAAVEAAEDILAFFKNGEGTDVPDAVAGDALDCDSLQEVGP